jgi:hypothetical protein
MKIRRVELVFKLPTEFHLEVVETMSLLDKYSMYSDMQTLNNPFLSGESAWRQKWRQSSRR